MGKGSAPKAPKYDKLEKAMAKSSEEATKIAREQLDFQKTQFDFFKEQGVKSAELTDKVTGAFLEQQGFSFDNAKADRAFYEQNFQPMEAQYAADAAAYDTPGRRAEEMGKAQADVATQYDAARDANLRELEGYGINPASTRFQAMDLGVRLEEAKAKAAAGNVAAWRTEDKGDEMQLAAINIGRGYPGQVSGSTSSGTQLGSGAVAGQNSTVGTMGQTQGTAPQYGALGATYMNTAQNGISAAGTLKSTGFNDQLASYNAEQASTTGFGDILGLAAGIGTKAFLVADGGAIPDGATTGGRVPHGASPSGGAVPDDVPAQLTPGEFVIPKDVVMWEGEKTLQKLIQKAREAKAAPENAKPSVGQGVTGPAAFQSQALPVG